MPQELKILYCVATDAAALAARAAQYFVEQAERAVAARGRARIAISGGSTPKAAFALLAEPAQPWRARMPWASSTCGGSTSDAYRRTTRFELPHNARGDAGPCAAAAGADSPHGRRAGAGGSRGAVRVGTAQRLPAGGRRTSRFDVVQLGMGPDGHTASLFPHTPALHELGRLAVANHVEAKDAWRVTLTWPVINRGSQVFFLMGGTDKAQILKEVFTGRAIRSGCPAS